MITFLTTIMERESGKPYLRVRPLPGQTDDEGNPIDDTMHVSCSRELRDAYPEGTVFATSNLQNMSKSYSARDMKPVCHGTTVYDPGLHSQYIDYTERTAGAATVFTDLFGDSETTVPVTPAPRKPAPKPEEKPADGKPLRLMETIRTDPKYATPTITDSGFFIKKDKWEIIVRNIIKRKNTLLTGPTGTGKTRIVALAAERLGLPVHWYDMGITKDPIATLIGSHRILDGKSVFDFSDFVEQIQKPGIILLDELSRAVPMALNILFPCLDDRRTLRAEMAGSTDLREIRVHPDCVFFATANIGDEYTGVVDELDSALKNRFFEVEMECIPDKEEIALLCRNYDINVDEARNIVGCAASIRNLKKRGDLSCSLSTRDTQELAEMVADGYTVLEALEKKVLPIFEGTDSEGERGTVKKIIMGR